MPSLQMYKGLMGQNHSCGKAYFKESNQNIEETWYDDPYSTVGYLYDYYNDNNTDLLIGLNPQNDKNKIPIDIKYIEANSQTYEKDDVTYRIQLNPSQLCNVPYYKELYEKRYSAEFPIGLYIDIKDCNGIYNKWMIVAGASINDAQFKTYEILRCDFVLQYIFENVKYQMSVVLRSQNSYNSGLWNDKLTTIPEDQQKFVVPLNRDTEKIFYNQRIIIDNRVLTEPRTWIVSKVNRIGNNGVALITLKQDRFDKTKDYIELDSEGNVVGMWADYYSSAITPKDFTQTVSSSNIRSEISFAGLKPELKIGGNNKKFTVKFYDNDVETTPIFGTWSVSSDYIYENHTINDLIQIDTTDSKLEPNQAYIKVLKTDYAKMWTGKIIKIIHDTGLIKSSIDIEIVGL